LDANITRFRVVSATNQRCPVTYGYAVCRRVRLQIFPPAAWFPWRKSRPAAD